MHIAGGELFQPSLYKYYPAYDEFFSEIHRIFPSVKMEISTNLLTDHLEETEALLGKHSIGLSASFDFVGRFTKQRQVDLFFDNIKRMQKKPHIVSVAHKPNALTLKYGKHPWMPIFNYLYENCNCTFEAYVDANHLPFYAMSPAEYAQFMIYLIEHYPKMECAAYYMQAFNYTPKGHCSIESFDLLPDFTAYSCCDKRASLQRFLHEKQCFSCKYQPHCVVRCFNEEPKGAYCRHKEIFDYVASKNSTHAV